MTLDQRRRRLLVGMALCVIAIAAISIIALAGAERHVTLVSSMPLWPALAILAGQRARVRAQIERYGPDSLEVKTSVSRKLVAVAMCGVVIVVALGVTMALRTTQ